MDVAKERHFAKRLAALRIRLGGSGCHPPKGKWGRHCCRPHSHRCVASSEEPNLASDVSPSFHAGAKKSGSVTGARTGIRIHPPAGSSRMIGAEAVSSLAYPALNGQLRGRMLMPDPSSGCEPSGPKAFQNAPIGRRPGGPARERNYLALPSPCLLASGRSHQRAKPLQMCRTDPATSFRFRKLR